MRRAVILLALLAVAAGLKPKDKVTKKKEAKHLKETRTFTDKNHPGCHRDVTIDDGAVTIHGIDGADGGDCIGHAKTSAFTVKGKVFYELDSDESPLDPYRPWIEVDFSSKGGPKKLSAALEVDLKPAAILFEDMNEWREVSSTKEAREYDDPNHKLCPRKLEFNKGRVQFTGADGPDGGHCEQNKRGKQFTIHGHAHNGEVKMDFSSKGGPKDVVGKISKQGHITWPDGNEWKLKKK